MPEPNINQHTKHTVTIDDLYNTNFSAADVVRATGIAPTDLQQLCNREVLKFSLIKFGSRTFRRFNLLEVLTVKALEVIRRLNLDYSKAEELIVYIRSAVGKYCMAGTFPSSRRYVMMFDRAGFDGGVFFFDGEIPIGNMSDYGAEGAVLLDLEVIIDRAINALHDDSGDPAEAPDETKGTV